MVISSDEDYNWYLRKIVIESSHYWSNGELEKIVDSTRRISVCFMLY